MVAGQPEAQDEPRRNNGSKESERLHLSRDSRIKITLRLGSVFDANQSFSNVYRSFRSPAGLN